MNRIDFKNKKDNPDLSSPFGGQGADFIIAGAGCAGLSLAVHLIHSGKFNDKKILIVEKQDKNKNDRTWCFWEKENDLFQSIVYKEWLQLFVQDHKHQLSLNISPYKYKLIRGIDFYNYCLSILKQQSNVEWIQADIQKIFSEASGAGIVFNNTKVYAKYVFNSLMPEKPRLKKNDYWMIQHFKGWFVKTNQDCFNPDAATLMDFNTDQTEGTAFFYALPFSTKTALIEYTLFSKDVQEDVVYEEALKQYVEKQLKITEYIIEEKEFGVIPMTNHAFPKRDHNIINIGTAGGQTKGSSGYTFKFIQKHSKAIVDSLVKYNHPFSAPPVSSRFRFYDSILLNILSKNKLKGSDIFMRMFQKNNAQRVLKFLDNESSISEELKIIYSLPVVPFTKAALNHIL
ncbi:MAG: lycopene cyclase family protein [Chitinophagaceae bacterium]